MFCSGLLVSLAFGVSCQRFRLSEIPWLNVKQPTSTQLRTRSGSQAKLVMSVSNSAQLDSIQHSRSGLIDVVDSGSNGTRDSIRLSSRSELNLISNEAGSTGPSRELSRLGDLSKRPARSALSESSSPPLRPELRAFGQHSERS